MHLIDQPGSRCGSSFPLGIDRSVTACENQKKADRTVRGCRAHCSRRLSSISLQTDRRADSGSQVVAMMHATKPWHRYHPTTNIGILLCLATRRRSLGQRKMSPVLVVIMDVLTHEALQMPFVENNHVVEQVSAAATDPTLGDAVLPRTSETGSLRLNAESINCLNHLVVEMEAAIEDQVAGCGAVWEKERQFMNESIFMRGWASIIGSLATIAMIVTALGVLLGVLKPAAALKRIGACLGIVILLMLIPGALVDLWSVMSVWQQIALAAIGVAMLVLRPAHKIRRKQKD